MYYGDNLDVLRRHVDDESVDLVYLDPPFNSNASYNVLFAERDGTQAASQIILSVKAGHAAVTHVRDLRGVLDREEADIGVPISLEEPTGPMRKEAASAGSYTSPWGEHPRLQLLTIDELLTGRGVDRPPVQTSVTFKRAPKTPPKVRETRLMPFVEEEESS